MEAQSKNCANPETVTSNKRMDIEIKYRLRDNGTFSLKLPADKYYTITDKKNFEDIDIPKHSDARQYVTDANKNIDTNQIEQTEIIISNSVKSDTIIRSKYFTEITKLIHRKDKNGYELIIQEIQVADNCVVITRMERDNVNDNWNNVNYNIGLNVFDSQTNERWFNSLKGEFPSANADT